MRPMPSWSGDGSLDFRGRGAVRMQEHCLIVRRPNLEIKRCARSADPWSRVSGVPLPGQAGELGHSVPRWLSRWALSALRVARVYEHLSCVVQIDGEGLGDNLRIAGSRRHSWRQWYRGWLWVQVLVAGADRTVGGLLSNDAGRMDSSRGAEYEAIDEPENKNHHVCSTGYPIQREKQDIKKNEDVRVRSKTDVEVEPKLPSFQAFWRAASALPRPRSWKPVAGSQAWPRSLLPLYGVARGALQSGPAPPSLPPPSHRPPLIGQSCPGGAPRVLLSENFGRMQPPKNLVSCAMLGASCCLPAFRV